MTAAYAFKYQFLSGEILAGTVRGNVLPNLSDRVFDLYDLRAALTDRKVHSQKQLIIFNAVYGQFRLNSSEVVLLGSNRQTGSCFSFNYRAGEASVFDARHQHWIVADWSPAAWQAIPIADELCSVS